MIEPISIPLLVVLLYALAIFPVGLMLGGPCSACCVKCDQLIPFDKCVKGLRVSPQAAPAINRKSYRAKTAADVGAVFDIEAQQWSLRFKIPGWFEVPVEQTITDSETVTAFLRGETSLTFQVSGDSWSFTAAEPTAYCGLQFCAASINNASHVLFNSGLFPRTISYTTPSPRETFSVNTGDRTITYTNYCRSVEPRPTVLLRPTANVGNACIFEATYNVCDGELSATADGGTAPEFGNADWPGATTAKGGTVNLQSFYCADDILSAIEGGPCVSSVPGAGDGYYTLGGSNSSPQSIPLCPIGPTLHGNACLPLEATMTLSANAPWWDRNSFFQTGAIAAGSYVLQLSQLDANCNAHSYSGTIPITNDGQQIQRTMTLRRRRPKWCEAFPETPQDPTRFKITFSPCIGGPVQYGLCGGAPQNSSFTFASPPSTTDKSISASPTSVPASGGSVTVTACCPQQSATFSILANRYRVVKTHPYRLANETVFVSQDASQLCYFGVKWKNAFGNPYMEPGTSGAASQSQNVLWLKSLSCPLIGEVIDAHNDGLAACTGWAVTSDQSWAVVTKTSPNKFEVTVAESASPQFEDLREASITISASGNTQVWKILQASA